MPRRPMHHSLTMLVGSLPVAGLLLLLQWCAAPVPLENLKPEELGYFIDLNSADRATLQLLPGVGPSLADAIVQHRESIGGFEKVEQLDDVPRISEKTIERIEPWVVVRPIARGASAE